MTYDLDQHHRRSVRLKGYDYSQAGAYFVTIVTQGRECLFGEIIDGVLRLNEAGQMVEAAWTALPQRFPGIECDAHVVMPNHMHGVIGVGATLVVAPNTVLTTHPVAAPNRAGTSPAPTLGDMVGSFKSITTDAYIQGVHHRGWLPFDQRVWQRNYYEHIIRSEIELNAIRQYVIDNPTYWGQDRDNPIKIRSATTTVAAYLSEAGLS